MSAGGSAGAHAAALRAGARRGLWRRVTARWGINPAARRADAQAANWDAGQEGERRTAQLLQALAVDGWWGLYDRALPRGGRANADFVLIPPCGTFLANVDAKLWSGRFEVHARGGPLFHGGVDRSKAVRSLLYETGEIRAAVNVRVVPMMAVHNAPVYGGGFVTAGIAVVPAEKLVPCLRSLVSRRDPVRAQRLALAARKVLPAYSEGG